ncbi:MAG: Cys-Gln thioester bond-forming surface protein [Oscillospiraceae bacterium]|jgi:hypothetical protein|nr:Cys-Gln thioester bond-forming surface protein [Oscillospiraceae bacterium]
MSKRKILATAIAIAVAASVLPALPASAEENPDANTYTVALHYDDNIQLKYIHPGADEWLSTTGDVPLGGATQAGGASVPQLYCADAGVPFHPYAASGADSSTSGWPQGDTVPNYVAVSPDNLPDILHGHWNELTWLVLNGYSDDSSLVSLNAMYPALSDGIGPLSPITYDVAVMATKAAVWHYTNPTVMFLSTNFLIESKGDPESPSGIKHRQFAALMAALVADADAHAADPGQYAPSIELSIDESFIAPSGVTKTDGSGGYYRGPYYVRSSGGAVTDKVALGVDGGGIGIVFCSDAAGTPIPGDTPIYGTADVGPGVYVSTEANENPFYIHATSTAPLLENITLTAFGRGSVYASATPIVLVHQNPDGSQDWNAVQAFIGSTSGNITVYSSARLPLHDVTGSLTVTKSADSDPSDSPALFRLTDNGGVPVSLGSTTIGSGAIVNGLGDDGIFQLSRGESVTIGNLLFGGYIVTELRIDGFDVPSYVVTQAGASSQPAESRAASVTLGDAPMNSLSLTFTNKLAPPPQEFDAPPPEGPEGEEAPPPEDSETPSDAPPSDTPPGTPTDTETPSDPGDPQSGATTPGAPGAPGETIPNAPSPTGGGTNPATGDSSNIATLAILFALSACGVAALLITRKKSVAR